MKKFPRVKEILIAYNTGGMVSVARYLSDENLIIEPDSFAGKMKKLLDSNNWSSMEAEIASVLHTFKLDIDDETNSYRKYKHKGFNDGGDTPS
jgi:hypothetical protein